MIYRLILLFLFFCQHIIAQDTLVLCKKNNPATEFKIKFEQYQVRVICENNKRFSALVTSYNDSVFVFKPLNRSKAARKEATALYEQASEIANSPEFTALQYDSVMQAAADKEKKIFYPSELKVHLSDVKKIKISIRERPDKKRLVKRLNIAGYSSLFAMLLLTPATVYLAPLAVVPFVAIPSFAFGLGFAVVDLIVETKRINLQSKWTVKAVL